MSFVFIIIRIFDVATLSSSLRLAFLAPTCLLRSDSIMAETTNTPAPVTAQCVMDRISRLQMDGCSVRQEPGEGRAERSERRQSLRKANGLHAPVLLQGHGRGIPPPCSTMDPVPKPRLDPDPGRRNPPAHPPTPRELPPQSGSGEVPLPPGLPFPRELLGCPPPPAASEPFLPGALG